MKFGRILTITLASMLLSTPFAHAQDEELETRRPPRKQKAGEETETVNPGISWTYAEAGYAFVYTDHSSWSNLDQGDNLNGLGLEVALEFFDHFHIASEYNWGKEDQTDGTSLERLFAGGGAHYSILETTDIYAELGYAYIDPGYVSNPSNQPGAGNSGSDDGVSLRAGVRSFVLPNLELSLRGSYADRGKPKDAGGAGRFGIRYYLTSMLAVSTYLDYDSDSQLTYFLGFRLDFGRMG